MEKIKLLLEITHNLSDIEIGGFLKLGENTTPARRALLCLIRNNRDFNLLCRESAIRVTPDLENPKCMCSLTDYFRHASIVTGFKITRATELFIRERFKNSKCQSGDHEFNFKFLRGAEL